MPTALPVDDPLTHPIVPEYGDREAINDLKIADMARIAWVILNSSSGSTQDKVHIVFLLVYLFSPLMNAFAKEFCRILLSPNSPDDPAWLVQSYLAHAQAQQLSNFPTTVVKLSAQHEAFRDATETETTDVNANDIKEGEVVAILVSVFGRGALVILSTLFMPKGGSTEAQMDLGVNAAMLKEVLAKLGVKPGFRSKFESFEKGAEAAIRWHQQRS